MERLQAIPDIVQLDSILDQIILFDRKRTFEKLNFLSTKLQPLKVMSSFSLENCDEIRTKMLENPALKFPFICKPNKLKGNNEDHQMKIVYQFEDLKVGTAILLDTQFVRQV